MTRRLKWLATGALCAGSFAWGTAVGFYQVFPYDQVRQLKNLVERDPGPPPHVLFDNPRTFVYADADRLSAVENVDVAFVGDSISTVPRWNEYFPGVSIINRGIGGDTISGVRRRLPEILSRRPRKIFLLVGVNDVFFRNTNDELIPIYRETLARMVASGARVYVQSIFCGSACTPEQRAQIADLNRRIAQLAPQVGAVYLDLASLLSGPDGLRPQYSADGLHPNGEGWRVWLALLRPLVEH